METIVINYFYDGRERQRDVRVINTGMEVQYSTKVKEFEVTFAINDLGELEAQNPPQLIDSKLWAAIADGIQKYYE